MLLRFWRRKFEFKFDFDVIFSDQHPEADGRNPLAQFFSGRGAFLPPDLHRVLQGDDGEAQELSGRGHEAVRDGQEDSPGDLKHLLFLRGSEWRRVCKRAKYTHQEVNKK